MYEIRKKNSMKKKTIWIELDAIELTIVGILKYVIVIVISIGCYILLCGSISGTISIFASLWLTFSGLLKRKSTRKIKLKNSSMVKMLVIRLLSENNYASNLLTVIFWKLSDYLTYLNGVFFHCNRPINIVQFVIKTTSITNGFTALITTPQWCLCCLTIWTWQTITTWCTLNEWREEDIFVISWKVFKCRNKKSF